MRASRVLPTAAIALVLGVAASAAPPEGKGGGKDKGGGDGGGDPPAEFVPAIAYKVETNKYEDIRLSNVAGDQSCLVLRVNKDNPAGRLRGSPAMTAAPPCALNATSRRGRRRRHWCGAFPRSLAAARSFTASAKAS